MISFGLVLYDDISLFLLRNFFEIIYSCFKFISTIFAIMHTIFLEKLNEMKYKCLKLYLDNHPTIIGEFFTLIGI